MINCDSIFINLSFKILFSFKYIIKIDIHIVCDCDYYIDFVIKVKRTLRNNSETLKFPDMLNLTTLLPTLIILTCLFSILVPTGDLNP